MRGQASRRVDLQVGVPAPALPVRVVPRLVACDQARLERERLELAVRGHASDRGDRREQVLHLLALVAVEVGLHARAQVLRLADVEHATGPVLEEVDAGGAGQRCGQRDLAEVGAAPRGTRLAQVAEREDAEVRAGVEEPGEHLAGRLGVREGAMRRLHARAEVAGQRLQPDVRHVGPHHPPGQLRRADRRALERRVLESPEVRVHEPEVERRVVRDEDRAAEELEQARQHVLDGRRPRDHRVADAGEPRDVRRDRLPRVDERAERAEPLAPAVAHGSHLRDRVGGRRAARGLQVDHDERHLGEGDPVVDRGLEGLEQHDRSSFPGPDRIEQVFETQGPQDGCCGEGPTWPGAAG